MTWEAKHGRPVADLETVQAVVHEVLGYGASGVQDTQAIMEELAAVSSSPRAREGEGVSEERIYREAAEEAWDWVAVALDAGGWASVFDIPDWQERTRRLEKTDPEYVGRVSRSGLEALRSRLASVEDALRELVEAVGSQRGRLGNPRLDSAIGVADTALAQPHETCPHCGNSGTPRASLRMKSPVPVKAMRTARRERDERE